MGKQLGDQAKACPCRDLVIPAAGEADRRQITYGDLGFNADVPTVCDEGLPGEETLDILRGFGRAERRRAKEEIHRRYPPKSTN